MARLHGCLIQLIELTIDTVRLTCLSKMHHLGLLMFDEGAKRETTYLQPPLHSSRST